MESDGSPSPRAGGNREARRARRPIPSLPPRPRPRARRWRAPAALTARAALSSLADHWLTCRELEPRTRAGSIGIEKQQLLEEEPSYGRGGEARVHAHLGGGHRMPHHRLHLPRRRAPPPLPRQDGKYLKHKNQKALFSALQRLKEELMLLGFISFVLSLSQGFIVSICIPETSTSFMLPCKRENHRVAAEGAKFCKKKGHVPLLSLEALHQLHIFIFVLGLVHVVFCATTILLGGVKMGKWKRWEAVIHREVKEKLQQARNEGQGTPLSIDVLHRDHQDEFVRKRTKGFWMKLAVVSWINAFLKQFHDSVSKSDYEALRSAFIVIHYPQKPDFDFHKYMIRAFEHEFKRVVGISWYLWLFVIFFLLLNINGWHTYFWLAFLPLFLLLIVGAKLEHIITRLAQEAATSLSKDTKEVQKIKPSKDHFWFHKPELVLHLIHFILFQNSFEIGFFFWVLVSEGFSSCMMERKPYAISRLVIGVIIEVICSYITLPLYAIVTHMTGEIKLHGLGSGVHEGVHGWLAYRKRTGGDPDTDPGGEIEVTRLAPKERSGSSRNMLMAPVLDEIVSVAGQQGP